MFFENEKVNIIFKEFLELRTKLKVINSDRAIKILVNKLSEYSDEVKFKMIERSIEGSWKTVYEIKDTLKNKTENPKWLGSEAKSSEASEEEIKELDKILNEIRKEEIR